MSTHFGGVGGEGEVIPTLHPLRRGTCGQACGGRSLEKELQLLLYSYSLLFFCSFVPFCWIVAVVAVVVVDVVIGVYGGV